MYNNAFAMTGLTFCRTKRKQNLSFCLALSFIIVINEKIAKRGAEYTKRVSVVGFNVHF